LCWLHSVGQNHFYVMLLLSQGCCFIQSLLFSYVLQKDSVKFSRLYLSSLSAVRTTWYSVRTLISQQHPSGRPSMSRSFEQFKVSSVSGCNGKSSGHSSEFEKIQCSSASVRTTWLYRPDAIQCLTSIRVSASRHSYGKTAATVRTMCDPVRTMSSIRQERANQVQPSGRQPSWSGRSSFIYGNCVHQFNRLDVSLQGPDAPKPYYGNYVP
jgi:hypothetical protein